MAREQELRGKLKEVNQAKQHDNLVRDLELWSRFTSVVIQHDVISVITNDCDDMRRIGRRYWYT